MRKDLNLGNSDFKNIIENNNYFVDKSLLIKEVIKSQRQILLLPRPRRFGKTMNLSMLRYFFDLSMPENKKLYQDLKIWQEKEIMTHCCRYPVIFMSFKDAKANDWEETLDYIKIEIAKIYEEHYYLYESDIIRDFEKKYFYKILSEEANKSDFATSIKRLSEYLYRYHKERTVILIDEYDTPIHSAFGKFYDDVISFMRNL